MEKKGYNVLNGIVITRYGHKSKCDNVKVIEASHPTPDKGGFLQLK